MLQTIVNLDIGVTGGIAVLGIAIMLITGLMDAVTTPGMFSVPFWVGAVAFGAGLGLKVSGIGD